MKPRPFKLIRVDSAEGASEALARHGEEARILAGGQSLVPMMNFRVAAPAVLVDINACTGLGGITRTGDIIRLGALTRHRETATSTLVADALPLLAMAMPHVGHLAICNRGTFGGSLAHADPAAELPACALLLDGSVVIGSLRGERRVAAADFFRGLYTTAIEPDELLLAVEFQARRPNAVFAFHELARRHGDFALAGIAASAIRVGEMLGDIAFVGFGIADRPVLLPSVARLAAGALPRLPQIAALKEALAADVEILPDNQQSPAMKAHIVAELILDALGQLSRKGTA
ncbi:MAG: xanthine dehydrogenase family protein subunit M [Alphaproteobacteria bacterium]|nr:xanthine dehydrogenase family protein subunit M [Alphaproteobacteria bacterium]